MGGGGGPRKLMRFEQRVQAGTQAGITGPELPILYAGLVAGTALAAGLSPARGALGGAAGEETEKALVARLAFLREQDEEPSSTENHFAGKSWKFSELQPLARLFGFFLNSYLPLLRNGLTRKEPKFLILVGFQLRTFLDWAWQERVGTFLESQIGSQRLSHPQQGRW